MSQSFTFIVDHVTKALARLPEQYKGKERLIGIVTALTEHAQTLEEAFEELCEGRSVETAEGTQLDGVGEIVGLERIPGDTDAIYREKIRVQIIQNLNQATPEEFIAAAKFFLTAAVVNYQELYPAAVNVFSTTVIALEDRERVRASLERMLPAGVDLAAFGDMDTDTPFLFDTGAGFGDTNDAEAGGLLADLY